MDICENKCSEHVWRFSCQNMSRMRNENLAPKFECGRCLEYWHLTICLHSPYFDNNYEFFRAVQANRTALSLLTWREIFGIYTLSVTSLKIKYRQRAIICCFSTISRCNMTVLSFVWNSVHDMPFDNCHLTISIWRLRFDICQIITKCYKFSIWRSSCSLHIFNKK